MFKYILTCVYEFRTGNISTGTDVELCEVWPSFIFHSLFSHYTCSNYFNTVQTTWIKRHITVYTTNQTCWIQNHSLFRCRYYDSVYKMQHSYQTELLNWIYSTTSNHDLILDTPLSDEWNNKGYKTTVWLKWHNDCMAPEN